MALLLSLAKLSVVLPSLTRHGSALDGCPRFWGLSGGPDVPGASSIYARKFPGGRPFIRSAFQIPIRP